MNKRLVLASMTIVLLSGLSNTLEMTRTATFPVTRLLAHEPSGGGSHQERMLTEGTHDHKTMEIPAGQPAPSVDLIVHPDAMRGWNLEVKVSNFRFAPEKINQDSNPQEGHAHLYANGKKLTRLYSSWYYLDNLNPGQHKISVTLNTNRHEELVYNGQRIEDTEIIQMPATNN